MLKKSELFLKKNKITTVNLGDNIKGESRNVAIKHAEKILKKKKKKILKNEIENFDLVIFIID